MKPEWHGLSLRAMRKTVTTVPGQVRFDRDLVRRYDVKGPRYTSYPTALQFKESFGAADYRRAVEHSNEDPIPRPLSLYLHIPFCASPCFYCGCTKVITRDRERAVRYLRSLETEIELVSALVAEDRLVKQLHFGGGTPTFLSHDQLDGLLEVLAGRFSFSAGLECAIEIDPRTVAPAQIADLAAAGFNRMSLGVQDFDPDVQKAVNREQSVEDTLAVIEAARRACSRGVNVDLIYGLPKQKVSSFSKTLDRVVEARPSRIAAYGYAHMPQLFKPQTQIREHDLPSAEERLALLELTVERLTGAGYVYIGMDHFALPEDDLVRALEADRLHRNFQGYSIQAACDTVGFGMSAIGDIGGVFSQNVKEIARYQALLDEDKLPVWRGFIPSFDDRLRRAVIREIMCRGRMDYAEIEDRFEISFRGYFAPEIERLRALEDDGLVAVEPDGIRVTDTGRLLLRAVAMVFDAYLSPRMANSARYSRVV